MIMMDYGEFLKQKHLRHEPTGFTTEQINPLLFDWQQEIVKWSLKTGRSALFESCGLGKTPQQLEWAQKVVEHTNKPVIVFAPVAVANQTAREGKKFSIPVNICRDGRDVIKGVNVTNYEKLHKFDVSVFSGVVLDESSILSSFMGKTKQALQVAFRNTPYKLCATATPARNDLMELLNQADYLGVMPSNEALARWFINDTMHFGKYRLKGHSEKDFWQWVASWAICLDHPKEMGYDAPGFDLPELNTVEHIIKLKHDFSNGRLFNDDQIINASNLYAHLRQTAEIRTDHAASLANDVNDQWLVWCNTNNESELLKKKIKGAVEVRGNMPDDAKEAALLGFIDGTHRVMIGKPSMCGFGLNLQHCHNMAFVGLSFSFEQRYQGQRRCWRFGQTEAVNDHVIMTQRELQVYRIVQKKEETHNKIGKSMAEVVMEFSGIKKEDRKIERYNPTKQIRLPQWLKSEEK